MKIGYEGIDGSDIIMVCLKPLLKFEIWCKQKP